MNKIMKYFYDRNKLRLLKEADTKGLQVIDDDKFHSFILKATKKSLIASIILWACIALLIIKWVMRI